MACPPNMTHTTLIQGLDHLRRTFLEACKTVDPSSAGEIDSFKKALHEAYTSIAEPFRLTETFEVPFRVYYHMLETTEECSKITRPRYEFDRGLEYNNLSIAEYGLRNLEATFSHMELAQAEDCRIDNTEGVARQNLQFIFDKAYALMDELIAAAAIPDRPHCDVICEEKLAWTERCRLAKSVLKFHFRIKDNRSSLNNEDLERNLYNVCKVTEGYLKRRSPDLEMDKQKLSPLIVHVFRGKSSWYKEWEREPKKYIDPEKDDKRLIQILFDESRSYLANAFLVLAIARNFGAHILNDESELFLEANYPRAFSMCLAALTYTLTKV
ncbi:MAG TPA: hypothetical protein VN739_03055 [Nitrososphaerales archaeon]|nr:hypothetical protein [Nitrososphaerales archaeon]